MDRRAFLGGFVVAAATGCVGFKWIGWTKSKPLLGEPAYDTRRRLSLKPITIRSPAIDPADYPPDPHFAEMLRHYNSCKDERFSALLKGAT